MITFKNPNDPDNVVITSKIQEWIKDKLNLKENAIIQVSEMDCADPGCADKETRITIVLEETTTKQYRIHKPLVFVRQRDIDHLIKN
jgi:hypothetical protein